VQDEISVDAETFELPSDENIVLPEKEKRSTQSILNEMGVGE